MIGARRPIQRRDATGHLDPAYERALLAMSRRGRNNGAADTHAFLVGPRTRDELGEELGEACVQSATTGENAEVERHDRQTDAETGGPFIQTSAPDEFAYEPDDTSMPDDATREPLPVTSSEPD